MSASPRAQHALVCREFSGELVVRDDDRDESKARVDDRLDSLSHTHTIGLTMPDASDTSENPDSGAGSQVVRSPSA